MKLAIISPYITTHFELEKFYNVQVFGLARELVKRGVEVDIFTARKPGDPIQRMIPVTEDKFFNVYYIPSVRIPHLPFMRPLVKHLKKRRYDIIQTSEDFQITTLQVALNKNELSEYLVIYQGMYSYPIREPFHTMMPYYDRSFGEIIKSRTDLVIAKTTSAQKFMLGKGYQNVVTIPVGCDCEVFYPRKKDISREKLGLPMDDPIVLYVGRFVPDKNLPMLIRGMKEVVSTIPETKLIMVGNGPLKSKIVNMAKKLGIEKNIKFLGKVPNKEMPFVYSAADVFVLPSNYEIFGMVLLESMACGTPVISTPTAGAKDLIRSWKNGVIVPFNVHKKLSVVLLDLLSDDIVRKKLGRKAQKTITCNYHWNVIGRKYAKALSHHDRMQT